MKLLKLFANLFAEKISIENGSIRLHVFLSENKRFFGIARKPNMVMLNVFGTSIGQFLFY
jgi:uncharacterized protein (UPF0128 family)